LEIVISQHAKIEANKRNIPFEIMMKVAESPEQTITSFKGRKICQSIIFDDMLSKRVLIRIIVKDIDDVRHVVTAYKTSKVNKYWEPEVRK